jgi:hypothetical protein
MGSFIPIHFLLCILFVVYIDTCCHVALMYCRYSIMCVYRLLFIHATHCSFVAARCYLFCFFKSVSCAFSFVGLPLSLIIPRVRPARTYTIPPWEMNNLSREIEQQAYNLIHITLLCVTISSQPLINAQYLVASNKLLVNNNKRANRAHYINYLMVNNQYNFSSPLG